MLTKLNHQGQDRRRILVAVDAGDGSLAGLEQAAWLGGRSGKADISLLGVAALGSGGSRLATPPAKDTAGVVVLAAPTVSFEPPMSRGLKRARDQLVRLGVLAEDWRTGMIDATSRHSARSEEAMHYVSRRTGQSLDLIGRESRSVAAGILNEARFYQYDLIVVAASRTAGASGGLDAAGAIRLVEAHRGTAIFARPGEPGGDSLLVCVDPGEASADWVSRAAEWSDLCGAAIHLYSVAADESQLKAAKDGLAAIEQALLTRGVAAASAVAEVGDPVWRIIERGRSHGLTVLAGSRKTAMEKLIAGSVSHRVLQKARSSVMIVDRR